MVTTLFIKILSGTVFRLVIQLPIHETLIMPKVSLLYVAKKFKFGAKIVLTNIYLSFITRLPLNKKKSSVIASSKVSSFTPLTLKPNIVPNVHIKDVKVKKMKE